jgi:hypothetical protein
MQAKSSFTDTYSLDPQVKWEKPLVWLRGFFSSSSIVSTGMELIGNQYIVCYELVEGYRGLTRFLVPKCGG